MIQIRRRLYFAIIKKVLGQKVIGTREINGVNEELEKYETGFVENTEKNQGRYQE